MKIWKQDTQTPTHRLVKLHCEEHSNYDYLGDLDTDGIKRFFLEIQQDMDIEKNLKLLNYYGYLHLFIVKK